MLRQLARAQLWVICVQFGIALSCAGSLQSIGVSDNIMVATFEVKHHEGQGCQFLILQKGLSSKCQLLHLLLVLLGPARIVHLQRTEEKDPAKPREVALEVWDCKSSLQKRSMLEGPSFSSSLTAHISRGKSRRSGRDQLAAPVFQIGFPYGHFRAILHSLLVLLCLHLWTASFYFSFELFVYSIQSDNQIYYLKWVESGLYIENIAELSIKRCVFEECRTEQ